MFPDEKKYLLDLLNHVQIGSLELEFVVEFGPGPVYVCHHNWCYSSFGERDVKTVFEIFRNRDKDAWDIRVLYEEPSCGEEDDSWLEHHRYSYDETELKRLHNDNFDRYKKKRKTLDDV